MAIGPLQPDDPRQLGPYPVTGRLGSGAMGVVYLGHDPAGHAIAIKTVAFGSSPEVRQRLAREAQLLESLRSPRLPRVVAADSDAQRAWIAMEYVPGPSLIEARLPLPDPALRQLATGLGEALATLHAAGITHRDVKPGNVILTYNGPVLVDLGIAATPEFTALTRQGMVVGTPAFMAPEQLRGQPLTSAVDVWGWGGVLVYAATGRPPFGEGEVTALAYRIQHAAPAVEGVPPWLIPAVLNTLRKDPAARPPARALAADPTAFALPADLAPTVLAAPAAGATSVLPPVQPSPPGPTTAETPPPSRAKWPIVAAVAAVIAVVVAVVAIVLATRSGSSTSASSSSPVRSPTAPTSPSSTPSSPSSSASSSSPSSSAPPSSSSPAGPTWPPLGTVLQARPAGSTPPDFPTSVDGYAKKSTSTTTARTSTGSTWERVNNFPVTMNDCALQRFYIRWRTIDQNATVQATFLDANGSQQLAPVSGAVGWMSTDSCGQPGFRLENAGGATAADVALTIQIWTPSG
jgi:serine/threonine protein kinase